MMFSKHAAKAAEVKFDALLEKAGEPKKSEILACLEESKKT